MEKGKISITIGDLIILYEGSEDFIKNDFNKLFDLEEICKILKSQTIIDKPKKENIKRKKKKKIQNFSDLISILKVESNEELVISALAYYYFLKNVKGIGYSDLYKLTKNKHEFSGKLKDILSILIDTKRIQCKDDKYCLSPDEIIRLHKKLKDYSQVSDKIIKKT